MLVPLLALLVVFLALVSLGVGPVRMTPGEVLDAILEGLVEREASVEDLVAEGFDRATVKKVEHLLYIAEYKRFQSAPGTRLTQKAFWLDRRYPIANRWRDAT